MKFLERLLTPREVSNLLRRPIRSVYQLIRSGHLSCIRDGRRIKFRTQDIEEYIKKREYLALK